MEEISAVESPQWIRLAMPSHVPWIVNGVNGLTLMLAPLPVVEEKPNEVASCGYRHHMVVWNAMDQRRMRRFATSIRAQWIVAWAIGASSQPAVRLVVGEWLHAVDR